tara:strand:+ start:4098 stop:4940 length:843 start_codon:yes stop_codon:yes gene_type:complete
MPDLGVTLVEVIDSRKLSVKDNVWSGTREYIAYSADETKTIDIGDVLKYAGLPLIGSFHPNAPIASASGYAFEPIAERKSTWKVTVTYDGSPPGSTGADIGFVSEQMSTTVKYVDIWRCQPLLSGNGYTVSGTDCNGTMSSSGGTPVSYPLPMLELRLTENVPIAPNFLGLATYVATRNSTVFGGAPVGSVVYGGSNSRLLRANVWQLSHVFYADFQMFHMRQRVVVGADGTPEIAGPDDVDDVVIAPDENAPKSVRWVQPFAERLDLHSVLTFDPYGGM